MDEHNKSQIAGQHTLVIDTRASFVRTVTLYSDDEQTTPIPLDGYTVRSQIRYPKDGALIKELTAVISNPTDGEITISLSEPETRALDFDNVAYYDVVITETATGLVTRVLEGPVKLSRGVTRQS